MRIAGFGAVRRSGARATSPVYHPCPGGETFALGGRWRGAGVAEQGCLLSSCAGYRGRGFESLPLRRAAGLAHPFFWRLPSARCSWPFPRPVSRNQPAEWTASCSTLPAVSCPARGYPWYSPDVGSGANRPRGPSGRFGFAGLQPGAWSITARHPGFEDSPPAEVVVDTGSIIEVRLQLGLAGITESVAAVSRRPLDLRGSGVRETVDRPVLEDLPNSRDIWTVLEQTPGIMMSKINVGGAESGQQSLFSAAGSAWTQNQYYLNGVNVTDPAAMGASIAYYSFDSFEEIEVSTAGHRAEIQTPGVFLNIVTRRGTNRFAGSGSFFYEHERFQAQNLDDALRARGVGQANRLKALFDGSAELGGPVRRDRAWFYFNYSRFRVEPFLPGFFFEDGEPGVDLTELGNVLARGSVRVAEGHEIGGFLLPKRKVPALPGGESFPSPTGNDLPPGLGHRAGTDLLVRRIRRIAARGGPRQPPGSLLPLRTAARPGTRSLTLGVEHRHLVRRFGHQHHLRTRPVAGKRYRHPLPGRPLRRHQRVQGGLRDHRESGTHHPRPARRDRLYPRPRAAHRGHALQRSGGRPEFHPERRTLRPGQPRPRTNGPGVRTARRLVGGRIPGPGERTGTVERGLPKLRDPPADGRRIVPRLMAGGSSALRRQLPAHRRRPHSRSG